MPDHPAPRPEGPSSAGESFTWRDGERTVRFGAGALAEAPALLAGNGFEGYALLTTLRAQAAAPALVDAAAELLQVPHGRVDELAAGLLPRVGDRPVVALGGGRVVDTAKAIAGAGAGRCAAVPTTLSGAPMTPFHRIPAGARSARRVRPALVVADPALMASQPAAQRAASAMNALAHAMESLYTPLRNPVSELAALRAAALLARELPTAGQDAPDLALAALLAGYAVGATGLAFHHAVCQTVVRLSGAPHAETNAVMLPHSAAFMAGRAPRELGELARALGDPGGRPGAAAGRVAPLAALGGHTRLSELGVPAGLLAEIARTAHAHPGVAATPRPPSPDELRQLLAAAV